MNELREYVKRKFNLSDDDYKKLVEFEKERIANPTFDYEGLTLDEAKQLKMKELDYKCSATILQGFNYTINDVSYRFSLSLSAQSNFQETGDMFKEGAITSETWTVLNNATGQIERISLDQATFEAVRTVARTTVRDNVSKLRDTLEPQIAAATSFDEVKAIVW